jgi:hypothetical protein
LTWARCYDFINIFAKQFGENIDVFAQSLFFQEFDQNIVFEKNAEIGKNRRKL